MSVNSQMNIERRLFHREPSGNNPERKLPLTNDSCLPRIDYINPSAITQAGLYDRIVKLPKPLKPWHPASKGTAERFKGYLSDAFPELKDLSEKDLKEIERKRNRL